MKQLAFVVLIITISSCSPWETNYEYWPSDIIKAKTKSKHKVGGGDYSIATLKSTYYNEDGRKILFVKKRVTINYMERIIDTLSIKNSFKNKDISSNL